MLINLLHLFCIETGTLSDGRGLEPVVSLIELWIIILECDFHKINESAIYFPIEPFKGCLLWPIVGAWMCEM